ncbi:MAG TPA: hypothetical protein DF637_01370 [Rikenellaceae bacterium]|nr:hypothetical protein [Rikenellaceae bacterium]
MINTGKIQFSAYPPNIKQNPAIELFHNSLIECGFEHRQVDFSLFTVCSKRGKGLLLIIHWPSFFWYSPWIIISILKLMKFILVCLTAKVNGYRLVWCAHNSIPHKYFNYRLELYARRFILRNFDLIVNLAKNASLERLQITGVKPVREVLAIHGHYEERYIPGNVITRETLGIPQESIVVLLHSNLKEYKGDIDFIDEFRMNATKKLCLVVTGEIRENELSHQKIIFLPGYKSEEEMADLIKLSDFFALPYKRITTSGAYMLAVTFEKPMITTDLPFFREHSLKDTALYYMIGDSSLRQVFEKIENGWKPDQENLREMKNLYTWKNAAINIKEAVNEMIKTGN